MARDFKRPVRNLVVVLGDQLDPHSAAFDGFDRKSDSVWMAEVTGEAKHVWSHKARIALFLSAMRHFRDAQRTLGHRVLYRSLDDRDNLGSLDKECVAALRTHRPQRVIVVPPGEWRVREDLRKATQACGIELDERPDRHFVCSNEDFAAHADGRRQLRLEYFYRELRRRHKILMEGKQPAGGAWNFDKENRGRFSRKGPGRLPAPASFAPDRITKEVLRLVERRFGKHPGSLKHFDWPVTPTQAHKASRDFISKRLASFGMYQDAMWTGEPYLYHARLSAALNLKLLNPRDVLRSAEQSFLKGKAPLAATEGFIRQVLGWREYVRGIYWRFMPDYAERNALGADAPLPAFYWTGETEMACLRECISQTLDYGYAHHIQRLMVTGLFALLLGVRPQEVHRWYLAVYVDAVEWVELPNTLGMSQFADGGVMASKPYVASGKYIQRMSNYCKECRYRPEVAEGSEACPITTLYWAFLLQHQKKLAGNPRMQPQLRNLDRMDRKRKKAIKQTASRLRDAMT